MFMPFIILYGGAFFSQLVMFSAIAFTKLYKSRDVLLCKIPCKQMSSIEVSTVLEIFGILTTRWRIQYSIKSNQITPKMSLTLHLLFSFAVFFFTLKKIILEMRVDTADIIQKVSLQMMYS